MRFRLAPVPAKAEVEQRKTLLRIAAIIESPRIFAYLSKPQWRVAHAQLNHQNRHKADQSDMAREYWTLLGKLL